MKYHLYEFETDDLNLILKALIDYVDSLIKQERKQYRKTKTIDEKSEEIIKERIEVNDLISQISHIVNSKNNERG